MKRATALLLSLALLLALCACGSREKTPEGSASPSPPVGEASETTPPPDAPSTSSDAPSTPVAPQDDQPEDEPELLRVYTAEDIKDELRSAISALRQPAAMELSGVTLSEHPELDVKNLYFDLLAENRAFCCAYDLTAELSGAVLTVKLCYMPYVTGEYPDGASGVAVSSCAQLLELAEKSLGPEPVGVRILDDTLTFDEMNAALRQAGGGYIVCTLSRDATAITFAPATGYTMDDCLTYIAQCEALAQSVVDTLVSGDMEPSEKARALYGYLTENVKYDQRYYSDKASMPYHSQTAYGALHDGLAICGGYSHALKLLFEKAGIACYNVSGQWGREYHMWNIARIDGEDLYFDATGDRGVSPEGWRYCGVDANALDGHTFSLENSPLPLLK